MSILPKSVQKLISEFEKLPGIGPKTAQRLSFYLLKQKKENLEEFGNSLINLKKNITLCSQCQNLAETDPCLICSDPKRDHFILCIVEQPHDILALEQTREFKGIYHVLYGAISPINNIGPENLKIKELLTRLQNPANQIKEIILATNPSLEGEATAMYISKLIKPLGIKITRIARGLPTGADLEYADEITLTNALRGRKEY